MPYKINQKPINKVQSFQVGDILTPENKEDCGKEIYRLVRISCLPSPNNGKNMYAAIRLTSEKATDTHLWNSFCDSIESATCGLKLFNGSITLSN